MAEASLFPPSSFFLRLAATFSYLVLLLFYAFLQRLQMELRGTEGRTWWASNGRDVVNALAVAVLAWGLQSVGYRGPFALLLSGTMVVLSTAIQPALGRWRDRPESVLAVSLALGLPPLVSPERWERAMALGLALLFSN